jgi:hypothetical protein
MTEQQQHPFTIPPEPVEQWLKDYFGRIASGQSVTASANYLAITAAGWGLEQRDADIEAKLQKARDEELDACCKWLNNRKRENLGQVIALRAARRPKPPSLGEQALDHLSVLEKDTKAFGLGFDASTIRSALKRLQELEGQVEAQVNG